MRYDAIVIGAGPGGYATAIRIAQKGKKVLVAEKDRVGGECLNYGCIPSKALIELANSIAYLRDMPGMKLDLSPDFEEWQKWKWSMVNKLTGGVETLFKAYGVELRKGSATILDRNTVRIGENELKCENLVIATGSVPATIAGFGDVWYNRDILDFKKVPESLVIIGGGYIGIELGTAFSKLGSKVTVVEMMDSILPGVDRDLVSPVERKLKSLGVEVKTSARVKEVTRQGTFTVKLEDGTELNAENVLLTVGRRPNTEGFGLENLKLEMNGRFIKTDSRKATSVQGVYAVGDVSGEPMLAHKAYYDADVAADNICGEERHVEYKAMPFVIYSDPEISYTGTKGEKVSVFPVAANGRSLGMNNSVGTYRVYYDSSGYITGAGLVAPHSSEMISEVSLAVEAGLMGMDLGLTIHPHPTISEGLREAAEASYGKALHFKSGR